MIGRTLSHYRIVAELGRGGMGVVYRAEDTRLGRDVALKVLPPELASRPERLARFAREARMAAALNHRNIVTLYSVEEAEGLHFLTMELVEGTDLAALVPPQGLPFERLLTLALPLADALAAAEERGVTHRDLKPGNVMVRADGTVKVLDFGLAKPRLDDDAAAVERSEELTGEGGVLGTTPYMAPEQLQGRPADRRSDLYALGVILFELASGQRPFGGTTTAELVSAVLRDPPPPLRELRPDLPADLERVVARCLAKDPEARYGSARELRGDLEDLRRGLPLEPRTAPLPISLPPAARRPHLALALLAAAMGAVLGLALWRWLPARRAQEHAVPRPLPVAVLPFVNHTGDAALDWLEQGVPDMVATHLSQSRYLQVVTQPEPAAPDAAAATGAAPPEEVAGTRPGIEVGGSVVAAGARLKLLSRLRELPSGRLLPAVEVEGAGREALLALADDLAGQIRVALEIEASGERDAASGVARTKTRSLDGYMHYVLGRDALDQLAVEQAITELNAAIELDPCFAHAHELLANAHDMRGEVPLAKEAAARAVSCAGRLPEAERLRMLRRKAQIDEDIAAEGAHLERLVALRPEDAEGHFLLGWHLFTHRRDCDASLREYRRAVELEPAARPHYHSYLGGALLACGGPQAALEAHRRHLALRPRDPYALVNLGYGLFMTGDYEGALARFAEAEELDPAFAEALLYRGDVLLELGRLEEAESAYRLYLERATSRNAEETALVALARRELERGAGAAASGLAEQALARDAESVEALWVRGLAEVGAGALGAARATAARMRAILEPKASLYRTDRLHHLEGSIALAAGEAPAAVAAFTAALAAATSDPAFYHRALALARERNGDGAGSLAAYRAALAINPNHPPSLAGAARLHEELGDRPAACEQYRHFLAVWEGADRALGALEAARLGARRTCTAASVPATQEGTRIFQGGVG